MTVLSNLWYLLAWRTRKH